MGLHRTSTLLMLLAGFAAFASGAAFANFCSFTLNPAEFALFIQSGPVSENLTIESAREREDRPGHYLLKRKPGLPWRSRFEPELRLVAGDPRRLLQVFSRFLPEDALTVYRYFEFEFLADDELSVPGPARFAELVAALELDNGPVFESVPGIYTPEGSVRSFVERRSISLATPGSKYLTPFLHDSSYHAPAVLIPGEYLRHAQIQMKFVLQFVDFLRFRAALEGAPLAQLDRLLDAWIDSEAIVFDKGTGDFAQFASEGMPRGASERLVSTLLREGRSPYDLLHRLANYSGAFYDYVPTSTMNWVAARFQDFVRENEGPALRTTFRSVVVPEVAVLWRAKEILSHIRTLNARSRN